MSLVAKDMALLNGTALVTGAGSGIGQATALAYARAGCQNIVLADRDESSIGNTAQMIGKQWPSVKTLGVVTDVSDQTSVDNMVKKTVEVFGTLDYAANVAGVTCQARSLSADYPVSEFDRVNSINARGLMFCVQAETRVMREQALRVTIEGYQERRAQRGSIVNIASTCGLSAIANIMPYVVSKHAVVGVTRAFAVDHGKDGIRINAVCPGIVETPMLLQRKAMEQASEARTGAVKDIKDPVIGRLAVADEIADICVFLSSSMASYMHGSMVMADGGKMAEY
ncbi:NAD(P)-binding protein [Mytilinidion resinicola]|uniref:NAD(P)-binding protein n=1 Tax=Mytilinidion resinicola TaxID=574789 RepID=A0A6A6Y3K7_9PEZI|nr:NAD(P)-binding protein [Mytilinidion resinicola]KAF2802367.1 NAD(P)-binding protein [Mytilinidion resinicola]